MYARKLPRLQYSYTPAYRLGSLIQSMSFQALTVVIKSTEKHMDSLRLPRGTVWSWLACFVGLKKHKEEPTCRNAVPFSPSRLDVP